MKLPRFTLSLRALMFVVLLSGVILGVIAYRLGRERRRAELQLLIARQFEVTDKILNEGEAEANAHVLSLNLPGSGPKGLGSRGSACNDDRWYRELRMHFKDGPEKRQVIDLRIRGQFRDLQMEPIFVEDRGGELNPKILERLVRAYREKGWPFRVHHTVDPPKRFMEERWPPPASRVE